MLEIPSPFFLEFSRYQRSIIASQWRSEDALDQEALLGDLGRLVARGWDEYSAPASFPRVEVTQIRYYLRLEKVLSVCMRRQSTEFWKSMVYQAPLSRYLGTHGFTLCPSGGTECVSGTIGLMRIRLLLRGIGTWHPYPNETTRFIDLDLRELSSVSDLVPRLLEYLQTQWCCCTSSVPPDRLVCDESQCGARPLSV